MVASDWLWFVGLPERGQGVHFRNGSVSKTGRCATRRVENLGSESRCSTLAVQALGVLAASIRPSLPKQDTAPFAADERFPLSAFGFSLGSFRCLERLTF